MNAVKIAAIVLIVAGVLGLAYGGLDAETSNRRVHAGAQRQPIGFGFQETA